MELTLRGRYFDLAQYLAGLETLPVRLLWGPGDLQVEQYPEVRLSLQVHTLSTQRALGSLGVPAIWKSRLTTIGYCYNFK